MSIKSDYIDGGIYVFIKNQHEEMRRQLGDEQAWLGTSLLSAQRKQPNRRGPTDRQLIETCDKLGLTNSQDQIIALTLNEAFLLVYHHKCLSIKLNDHLTHGTCHIEQFQQQQVAIKNEVTSADDVQEQTIERNMNQKVIDEYLDLKSCWLLFRSCYNKWNKLIDFGIEFSVYYHYYSLGWIVKSGENYGTNFLLYERGPTLDHARYGCIIVQRLSRKCDDENEDYIDINTKITYQSLMAHSRVIQSVSKELLIAIVGVPNEDYFRCQLSSIRTPPDLSSLSHSDLDGFERFIKDLKIKSKIFRRHSNNLTTM